MKSIKLALLGQPIIIQLMTGGSWGAGLGHGGPCPPLEPTMKSSITMPSLVGL